jgi:two-component system phosphate regulon response regulator PhoB
MAASAPAQLLLVAHDPAWRMSLAEALQQEGFQVHAMTYPTQVRELLEPGPAVQNVQLLIVNVPGSSVTIEAAVALVQAFRRRDAGTPLLLLPDQAAEEERVALLEAGADDVLLRGCGMREFVARCRALLRRVKRREVIHAGSRRTDVLRVGPITLHRQECRVFLEQQEVSLSPKEFRLLECFMLQPGRALSREQLLDQVWGPDFSGDSKSIDVHVLWLRRKLEVEASNPKLLITVRGIGYRLDPPGRWH